MVDTVVISEALDDVDWAGLAEVYRLARGKLRGVEAVRTAFRNSFATVVAWRGGQVVGAARALSDGIYYATIVDVAVLPDDQGQGVGRLMMETLLEKLPADTVYLNAVVGKEGFYEKLGFAPLSTVMGRYGAGLAPLALG